MPPEYTDEERTVFLRDHPDLQYSSRQLIEQEMSIEDARISLEVAERYMSWLLILNEPESPAELRTIAAEMIYLHGFMDAKQGRDLP
jgi:hypothetical protein